LDPRVKAIEAKAPSLVPEMYDEAEKQFVKATAKVESGDVKGGLKEAGKSSPLFDVAELNAIRIDILGAADRLIEKAVVDDAKKFALSTLDKAYSAREKANNIITANRYNRTAGIKEATRAEYEARHASNIALSVRALNRNDQAWEKLMLIYEIQMNRIGQTADLEYLPFDNGPLAVADTLIRYITDLKEENDQVSSQMIIVTEQLKQVLDHLGQETDEEDPLELAASIDRSISDLLVEKNTLAEQIANKQSKLTELSKEHEEVAAELTSRQEREEKFRKAKQMLNPSEGQVLFNSANDIVLRLSGLSFDVGEAELKDEHITLLEKVQKIITMFPEARIVVEGHTDASGERATNMVLSEKRAFAVMQYLRQSLLISAEQIHAMGYGSDRPVASNQTTSGRAKNRRIDVIVMR
jgi:outer membrane protein OmpA-like peptidoglycan-associated protein